MRQVFISHLLGWVLVQPYIFQLDAFFLFWVVRQVFKRFFRDHKFPQHRRLFDNLGGLANDLHLDLPNLYCLRPDFSWSCSLYKCFATFLRWRRLINMALIWYLFVVRSDCLGFHFCTFLQLYNARAFIFLTFFFAAELLYKETAKRFVFITFLRVVRHFSAESVIKTIGEPWRKPVRRAALI